MVDSRSRSGIAGGLSNYRAGTLAVVPLAVVAFAFDPYLRIGDRAVRLEAIGIAVAILVGLVGAAIALRGLRRREAPGLADAGERHVPRFDDLLLIALAAIPGAAVGGRVGYGLIHLDYYRANGAALVDPGQGSLELGLGIVGGTLTAAILVRILDRGLGSWLHVVAVPLLGALALGKIVESLGGSGQGAFTDATVATAYLGTGPWGSLAPDMPAWPSQLIEGVAVLAVAPMVAALATRARHPDGRVFLVALGLWALVRFVVAFTWRDASIAGPLAADQLISLAIAACAVLGYVRLVTLSTSRSGRIDEALPGGMSLGATGGRLEDR